LPGTMLNGEARGLATPMSPTARSALPSF
jgi:hypothetical protein